MSRDLQVLPYSAYVRSVAPILAGARALTHLANITFDGTVKRAYVKAFRPTAPRGLINEVIGYIVGQATGLPQPKAALIMLPAPIAAAPFGHTMPGNSEPIPCFVTIESYDPAKANTGMAKTMFKNDLDAAAWGVLKKRLLGSGSFALIAAFDSWLANVDRNLGNLLFSGVDQIVVIDNSDLLTGPAWTAADMNPSPWHINKLLDEILLAEQLPLPVKSAILKCASKFDQCHSEVSSELDKVLAGSHTSAEFLARTFIRDRASIVEHLLRQRLGMVA